MNVCDDRKRAEKNLFHFHINQLVFHMHTQNILHRINADYLLLFTWLRFSTFFFFSAISFTNFKTLMIHFLCVQFCLYSVRKFVFVWKTGKLHCERFAWCQNHVVVAATAASEMMVEFAPRPISEILAKICGSRICFDWG